MAKKKTKGKANVWAPQPNDAIRLAAIRWFALEMERMAIEIYATDQSQFTAMERVLRQTLKKMGKIHRRAHMDLTDGCPDGYILCKDNTCAPMCDGGIGANSDA